MNTTFATGRTKHLSKGLNLIHKVLSRPLDIGISHLDKCLSYKEVDMDNHDGFKDYISSLAMVFNGHHQLSKHGKSMSEPANLILPFLIYNLEGSDRDEFTNDMPWILKKFVVPIIWKSKWEKMKPFLLA